MNNEDYTGTMRTTELERDVGVDGLVSVVDYKPHRGDMLVYKQHRASGEYVELLVMIRRSNQVRPANNGNKLWHCWTSLPLRQNRWRIEVLNPLMWFPLSGTLTLVRP